MSESLNRAFLKAYDKEKASEAKRQAHAAERQTQQVDDLIMQFDTTMVSVPTPHFLKATAREPASVVKRAALAFPAVTSARRPTGPTSIGPTSNGPTSHRASPVVEPQSAIASQERSAPEPNREVDLRESIALQMMRASAWEDQRIDAFSGGFPVAPSIHASLNSSPTQPPATSAPVALPEVESEPTIPRPAPVAVAATAPNIPATNIPPLSDALPSRSTTHHPELTAPHAPALSSDEAPHRPATLPTSHERDGHIFRLDQPSYNQPTQAPLPASAKLAQDDSQEDVTGSGECASSSGLNFEVASHRQQALAAESARSGPTGSEQVVVPTAPKAPAGGNGRSRSFAGEMRQVEEKLRRARVRIFNPVWEVDSLQWPPVCTELLERMNGSMKQIADQLMAACQEGLQILAVTSPQRGEGSTTVACCLALLAGNHGLNVAIVDGDIEKPSLSYQTNLEVDQDWRSAIMHQLPLEEIAVHSIDDQITLVPLLNPIGQHEISADDDRIGQMMQELSESFDLVIIDAGQMDSPRSLVGSLGEQGLISAAVAVVDHRNSTPERIEACLRRIRQSGIASIGLVENFAA